MFLGVYGEPAMGSGHRSSPNPQWESRSSPVLVVLVVLVRISTPTPTRPRPDSRSSFQHTKLSLETSVPMPSYQIFPYTSETRPCIGTRVPDGRTTSSPLVSPWCRPRGSSRPGIRPQGERVQVLTKTVLVQVTNFNTFFVPLTLVTIL